MAFVSGPDPTRPGAKMMLEGADTPTLDNHGSPRGAVPTRVDHDSSLVVALRRGEPSAADNLVAAYGNRAFRLATRITGSAEDAEEVVQDAMWSVILKIQTFRGDCTFGRGSIASWPTRPISNSGSL